MAPYFVSNNFKGRHFLLWKAVSNLLFLFFTYLHAPVPGVHEAVPGGEVPVHKVERLQVLHPRGHLGGQVHQAAVAQGVGGGGRGAGREGMSDILPYQCKRVAKWSKDKFQAWVLRRWGTYVYIG